MNYWIEENSKKKLANLNFVYTTDETPDDFIKFIGVQVGSNTFNKNKDYFGKVRIFKNIEEYRKS